MTAAVGVVFVWDTGFTFVLCLFGCWLVVCCGVDTCYPLGFWLVSGWCWWSPERFCLGWCRVVVLGTGLGLVILNCWLCGSVLVLGQACRCLIVFGVVGLVVFVFCVVFVGL